MKRIIVMMEEEKARSVLVDSLCKAGFDPVCVNDHINLTLELLRQSARIVILHGSANGDRDDAMLVKLRATPGMEWLGVIMLIASQDAAIRTACLHKGADVCLSWPAESTEVAAYAASLARRLPHQPPREPEPAWQFRQNEWRLVSPSGTGIELSHLEAAFVAIIARNAGKPVRRRDIISDAFGKDPLSYDSRRLEAVVSRLRKKVQRSYPQSQPIKVVHSIGYVFTEAIQCQ